jgi:hypothetical protein
VASFDWNNLVETRLPSSTPFHIRGILRYIVDKVTSASILSSLTWKALGFPQIMSALREILKFHRSPAREPWPPPLHVSYKRIHESELSAFPTCLKRENIAE